MLATCAGVMLAISAAEATTFASPCDIGLNPPGLVEGVVNTPGGKILIPVESGPDCSCGDPLPGRSSPCDEAVRTPGVIVSGTNTGVDPSPGIGGARGVCIMGDAMVA